ncbi:hypothetical protein QQ73_13680, partial [Candidatus Endoriftia persephone str. Guaymas]|nr:hypothetical protein [Candidatus Endoriftia persephone str. Guaymas]
MNSVSLFVIPVTVFIVLCLIIFSNLIAVGLFNKPALGEVISLMAPVLFFYTVSTVQGEAFKAIRHTVKGTLFQNALFPLLFMVFLYILLMNTGADILVAV